MAKNTKEDFEAVQIGVTAAMAVMKMQQADRTKLLELEYAAARAGVVDAGEHNMYYHKGYIHGLTVAIQVMRGELSSLGKKI